MPLKQSSKKAELSKVSAKKSPVRDFWENLSWMELADFFDDRTIKRGKDYAKNGNVESIWMTDDGGNILAVVIGTEEYHTLVSLEVGKGKQFTLKSECSCPVGFKCKHGVAAIAKYLELLASDKPIGRCVQKDEKTWEAFSPDGRKRMITIDEWEEEDGDDNDWGDDEYEEPICRASRSVKTVKANSEDGPKKTLMKKLQPLSAKELTALIIQLFEEYDQVREHFEQEAFADSVAATGDVAKLVEKAIKMIDKEFGGVSFDYDDWYHRAPSFNPNPVSAVIKQLARFDDPLPAIDRVAKHLIKRGIPYVEESQAEETDDIDGVFGTMAEVLLRSKADPVKAILWVHEISGIDEYDFMREAREKILGHAWPVKVWSRVADEMLAGRNVSLRTIVETLDKAKRQKEATDFLRKKAPQADEYEMLVERLIAMKLLDEAEKIALERREAELKIAKDRRGFYDDPWPEHLKKIAEKRKDWPTLASIQAAEFFERPCQDDLRTFLLTVKKIAGIESAIRKSVEAFLHSGELPAAIKKSLQNEKPTPSERKRWPLPFFSFQPEAKKPEPRFDVLCEWAIDERRADDVIKWYDESQKSRTSRHREFDLVEIADAICESHPDRAFRIYRDQAEHEMEVTRQYQMAVKTLHKARKALENAGRGGEWPGIMEEIRATHRRKTSLMKELKNLDTPSIVQQKRKGQ